MRPSADGFSGELHQTFKEELQLTLTQLNIQGCQTTTHWKIQGNFTVGRPHLQIQLTTDRVVSTVIV